MRDKVRDLRDELIKTETPALSNMDLKKIFSPPFGVSYLFSSNWRLPRSRASMCLSENLSDADAPAQFSSWGFIAWLCCQNFLLSGFVCLLASLRMRTPSSA